MFDPFLPNNNNKAMKNMNSKKIKKFQKIIISDIEILFPYSLHESQIHFMKRIINNLNMKFVDKGTYKGICALESPSGTKKILCTLSACLAWINDMRRTNTYQGKIIFIAKNYTKILKIIKYFDLIYYKPKICVLFSPCENYINDEINFNENKNDNIIFLNCNDEKKNFDFSDDMDDGEKIKKNKKNLNFSYFYEKNEVNKSDIIFMTYENFFDKNIKDIYGYDIKNNILILDDGENFDKICENFNSIAISTLDLEDIKKTLFEFAGNKYLENILKNDEYNNINIDDIKNEIISIDRIISNINLNAERIYDGEVFPNKGLKLQSKEFLSLFLTKNNDNNIDDMQYITLNNIKNHIILLINIEKIINLFLAKNSKIPLLYSILEKIYNFYINQGTNIIDSYTFFIFFEKKGQIAQNIKLNIYCFDPSLSFNDLIINEKPFSVFLISNYFGPYEILEYEFKTRFDVKSKNNCIYPTDNYQINIIESTLFQEEKIDFILDEINSDNIKMKIALGYTLLSLCYCNPLGNTLVFFPSMTFLYQCNMLWRENNIIEKISKIKKIKYYQENEEEKIGNNNFIYFLEFELSNSGNKLKELKNKNISMVIILGLPQEKQYNFSDKIQLKINYIDSIKNKILKNKKNINYEDDFNLGDVSGEIWNEKNIMTPINIFISKILKLINGLGSIICIDNRYIDAINDGCFCYFLKKKVEIVNIKNRTYFDDLLEFYQKIENKIKKNYLSNENAINFPNKNYNNILNNNNTNNVDNNPQETENYFIYKILKTKLFCLKKQQSENRENDSDNNDNDNYINISNNETIPKKKYNIINNDININIEMLKKKQYRKVQTENENVIINNNKKLKKELQNNIDEHDPNKFINICNEYDHLERDNEVNEENNNSDNNEEIEYNLDTELLNELNNNCFTEQSNEIYECPICFKVSNKFPDLIYSMAKCKHVLCNDCWCGWFTQKFECPLCKKKARPKTLKKIVFTN